MRKVLMVCLAVALSACSDPNSEPEYGAESHLPANCRAYVHTSIEAWRSGEYDTDETMEALERNCGLYGDLWDYKP